MAIYHSSHPQHKLAFEEASRPYYCSGCDQSGFGMSYVCNQSECNFVLHEQCGKPEAQIKYPFSNVCVLTFHKYERSGEGSTCVACGKKIKGYHYRCVCSFIKRNIHPYCLSHKHRLEAADGLTLYLRKEATTKCMKCGKKHLGSRVHGWAYMSSCGNYCYHVSCVMEIINENWKNAFWTGKSDPFQCIKERFPEDKDKMHHLGIAQRAKSTSKHVSAVLSLLYTAFTGNPSGLVGAAKAYFV